MLRSSKKQESGVLTGLETNLLVRDHSLLVFDQGVVANFRSVA